MQKIFTLIAAMAMYVITTSAQLVDFSKIRSWAGSGENRAALVVTNDAGASDPHVYVWGYRWPAGETRTGEDMFRAVCAANDNLVLLTQVTGIYGSTVCGIGVGKADELLRHISFDFDAALESEFINFDYYHSNSFFGQKDAPGDNTPVLCREAIELAHIGGSHVIQHPIDHPTYGYPAYDYDCWPMDYGGMESGWWNSAWYSGYWSYWTASANDAEWMYSGMGFTGRQLTNGCVDAWSFTMFDSPQVGGVGEGNPPSDKVELYVYCNSGTDTGIGHIRSADPVDFVETYHTLSGLRVEKSALVPGVYLVRSGGVTHKTVIRP